MASAARFRQELLRAKRTLQWPRRLRQVRQRHGLQVGHLRRPDFGSRREVRRRRSLRQRRALELRALHLRRQGLSHALRKQHPLHRPRQLQRRQLRKARRRPGLHARRRMPVGLLCRRRVLQQRLHRPLYQLRLAQQPRHLVAVVVGLPDPAGVGGHHRSGTGVHGIRDQPRAAATADATAAAAVSTIPKERCAKTGNAIRPPTLTLRPLCAPEDRQVPQPQSCAPSRPRQPLLDLLFEGQPLHGRQRLREQLVRQTPHWIAVQPRVGVWRTGSCAQGRCCDSPCNGVCLACNVEGFAGTCRPVPYGGPDPTGTCKDDACSNNCNGAGSCARESVRWGTLCKAPTCGANNSVQRWACGTDGSCVLSTTTCPSPETCMENRCVPPAKKGTGRRMPRQRRLSAQMPA